MSHSQEIARAAVIGAGSIGVAWAIVFARGGVPAAVYDPDPARLHAAAEEIRSRLADLTSFSLLDEAGEAILGRVAFSGDLREALGTADYVQECAPEDLPLKRRLFAELDAQAAPHAVLASSSSAITASAMAGHVPGRARCLVVHPGNPPYLIPIAEVVPSPETGADIVERTMAFLERVGMAPVLVRREVEGFIFNRLQGAVLREAYCLVRDGVASAEDVDRVMREGPGLRWSFMGPFETADLNTRGGIVAHAERLGPAYARMGAERGQDDPWTPELVAQVAAERRARLPLDHWADRVAWRDRMLMALARSRRTEQA